tara:strand:- start:1154 stop:1408 length:255 start_codon:yes stop_codon:yes gene_type:complete
MFDINDQVICRIENKKLPFVGTIIEIQGDLYLVELIIGGRHLLRKDQIRRNTWKTSNKPQKKDLIQGSIQNRIHLLSEKMNIKT